MGSKAGLPILLSKVFTTEIFAHHNSWLFKKFY